MERRVRQVDLLSSFLFILAAEGLNALMKEADSKSIKKGIHVGEDEVMVSHLQYADDTIIFGEWGRENARNLMNILKCYEEVSGLKINLRKSKLYGVGVERVEVERMARYMRYSTGDIPFTYLGLPIGVNMGRVVAWNGVIENFKNKLSEWKAKTMSFGERLMLVKLEDGKVEMRLKSGGVWAEIIKVGKSFDRIEGMFVNNFYKTVGDGLDTSFWLDKWVGDSKLRDHYPRIFRVER
nr:protein kinase-like domain, beta-lactamase/transpeptidase-like protein [Tanacetum cinerariifolium]